MCARQDSVVCVCRADGVRQPPSASLYLSRSSSPGGAVFGVDHDTVTSSHHVGRGRRTAGALGGHGGRADGQKQDLPGKLSASACSFPSSPSCARAPPSGSRGDQTAESFLVEEDRTQARKPNARRPRCSGDEHGVLGRGCCPSMTRAVRGLELHTGGAEASGGREPWRGRAEC